MNHYVIPPHKYHIVTTDTLNRQILTTQNTVQKEFDDTNTAQKQSDFLHHLTEGKTHCTSIYFDDRNNCIEKSVFSLYHTS